MQPKAIQELFELDYGRMNATLGVELPFTNAGNQTTLPIGYTAPPTEILQDGVTQIWKITHNGVDTHAIHFHLFNVQLINRVGWDGAIRMPDANELGWKETVRMNPLEDAIVALKPVAPAVNFTLPDSIRRLDPTKPDSALIDYFDSVGKPITVPNAIYNFGEEYVWHCHLLGHEENDMMRPIVFYRTASPPVVPTP
jgi:FtsP/CotA-like multicopper oxidase with cupredoxin domain